MLPCSPADSVLFRVVSRFSQQRTAAPERLAPLKIYLGNLSYLTGEEELAALLAPFGPSAPPRLATHPETGLPRGYALAEFPGPAAAEAAIAALNGTILHGRIIIVRGALPGQ